MDYSHFTNFNLTDMRTGRKKNLFDDFGGTVINVNDSYYERECMPDVNFNTSKNSKTDGEYYMGATYAPRYFKITCFFSEENGGGDLSELKRWLHKQHNGEKLRQLFEWDGDDEEKAIYVIFKGFGSKAYYQKKFYGEIDLEFVAHEPYWGLTRKEEIPFKNLVAGSSVNIGYNKGNTEAYPLIKVVPNTNSLSFKWNNELTVNLMNLTIGKEYYMDSKIREMYTIENGVKSDPLPDNISTTKWKDYPVMDSELTNNLTMITGSASFYINPRTRII